MVKAKDLDESQKYIFSEYFYMYVNFDDRDCPNPWGCPWFWRPNFEFEGNSVISMVLEFINHFEKDLKKIQDLERKYSEKRNKD